MCYDLSFSSDIESIFDYLPGLSKERQLDFDFTFQPTFHRLAQALPKWPIVLRGQQGLELKELQWGSTDNKWSFNARGEKVTSSYTHAGQLKANRCLIPATGFFEYRDVGKPKKTCYHVKVKDRQFFFIAGLFSEGKQLNPVTGDKYLYFSVITRAANEVMEQIHNSGENKGRMPLILSPELEQEWLNPNLNDLDISEILKYSIDSRELEYWPVKSVRAKHPDDSSVVERVEVPGEPEILV